MDVAISRKNITESYDDIMDSYLSSEEYNRKVSGINLLYVALRAELSPDQQKKLDSLLTAYDNLAHDEAEEALLRGSLGFYEHAQDI